MTDNEKRAHDLAIAVCSDIFHAKINNQTSSMETDISIDCFADYMNAYKAALAAFSREFPDNK